MASVGHRFVCAQCRIQWWSASPASPCPICNAAGTRTNTIQLVEEDDHDAGDVKAMEDDEGPLTSSTSGGGGGGGSVVTTTTSASPFAPPPSSGSASAAAAFSASPTGTILCPAPAPTGPRLCCAAAQELSTSVRAAPTDLVATIIRATYEESVVRFGGFDRKKRTVLIVAFDISFLWHYVDLGTCAGDDPSTYQVMTLHNAWSSRPLVGGVASCHPTAENLCRLIGRDQLGTRGVLGPRQSPATATMADHRVTAEGICTTLTTTERCMVWVTNSGHSFVLIRRGAVIEMIDSFANDRGLGLWACSSGELATGAEQYGKEGIHLPPARRTWDLAALCPLIRLLAHDSLDRRYEAQTALSNYAYERSEGPDDHLPGGPFGFNAFALPSDADLFARLVSHFMHAYRRWKRLSRKA